MSGQVGGRESGVEARRDGKRRDEGLGNKYARHRVSNDRPVSTVEASCELRVAGEAQERQMSVVMVDGK
jgi:hypothetical protein